MKSGVVAFLLIIASLPVAGIAGPQPATPGFSHIDGGTSLLEGNSLGYSNSVDLDGDGVDELVLAIGNFPKQRAARLPIMKWDGAQFTEKAGDYLKAVPASEAFTDVVVDDFNGDKRGDVFLGAFGYDDVPFPGSRDTLLLQTKGGKLKKAANRFLRKTDTTYYATSGDINNDGYPDIFVVNLETTAKTGPYFLISKGAGRYVANRKLINPLYAANANGASALSSAAIADIDNDGWNDLIVGREDGQYVGVYLNDKGSFRRDKPDIRLPRLALGAGSTHPHEIKAIDYDLDGYTDLVIFSTGWPDFQPFALEVFRNLKGKAFKNVTGAVLRKKGKVRGEVPGIGRLRVVDFFGDGLTDLVGVSEAGPNTSSIIFINDGAGRFREYGWNFFREVQGHGYRSLIAADLNGDKRTDLVTAYPTAENGNKLPYQFDAYVNDGVDPADVKRAPRISRKPKSTKIRAGERIHLSVLVRGDRPFTFRWFKNGRKIKGADGPVLKFNRARRGHSGKYSVEISNAAGAVTSPVARIRVR